MQDRYTRQLNWIAGEKDSMVKLVESWSSINSWSENLPGLQVMLNSLCEEFSSLKADTTDVISLGKRRIVDQKGRISETGLGQALLMSKHPNAPIQVFLGGHMDTVYSPASPFQKVVNTTDGILNGPGVLDMKGGLVVMLKALQALELSDLAGNIGWQVLINPDEEIGSPGSERLFIECAKKNHVGLIFEPSFPDGSLVSQRKGSANFAVVCKGKAAHAGRDFHAGKNAIVALSQFVLDASKLSHPKEGTTVNIGHIEGGGPVNIVPDFAISRLNVRVESINEMTEVKNQLRNLTARHASNEGISLELFELGERMPKIFDAKHKMLYEFYKGCANELGIPLDWRPSGGVCDANILSLNGLPTVDSLGVIGGKMHTEEEYMLINSLVERTSLTALFLFKLASHEIELPRKEANK